MSGQADSGQAEPATSAPGAAFERVLTVPNVLSFLRLLGVPLFLWLVLGPHADVAALVVLMLSGISDYLDGKIARAWGQTSRIGELLDPTADRLYVLATLAAFVVRDVIPLWFALVLVARELMLAVFLVVLHRYGHSPLPVHFLGKAATFNLLYAFPLLLLGIGPGTFAEAARAIGWAFAVWGAVLYWVAGLLYVLQVRALLGTSRSAPAGAGATDPVSLPSRNRPR